MTFIKNLFQKVPRWHRLQLHNGFDSRPENFHVLRVQPKKKKKKNLFHLRTCKEWGDTQFRAHLVHHLITCYFGISKDKVLRQNHLLKKERITLFGRHSILCCTPSNTNSTSREAVSLTTMRGGFNPLIYLTCKGRLMTDNYTQDQEFPLWLSGNESD